MLLKRASLLAALLAAAFTVHADNLDINLGSNAAYIDYSTAMTGSGLYGDLGYLHHTDQVDMGQAGLELVGNASPVGSPVIFGVGGKLFYVSPKQLNENGTVVGLGGHVNFTWPTYNRFVIGGELYYAPSIVSFNKADRFLEFGVHAGYEILRNAQVYVGYRHVGAAFTGTSTVTLDSTIMAGLNITF